MVMIVPSLNAANPALSATIVISRAPNEYQRSQESIIMRHVHNQLTPSHSAKIKDENHALHKALYVSDSMHKH